MHEDVTFEFAWGLHNGLYGDQPELRELVYKEAMKRKLIPVMYRVAIAFTHQGYDVVVMGKRQPLGPADWSR